MHTGYEYAVLALAITIGTSLIIYTAAKVSIYNTKIRSIFGTQSYKYRNYMYDPYLYRCIVDTSENTIAIGPTQDYLPDDDDFYLWWSAISKEPTVNRGSFIKRNWSAKIHQHRCAKIKV